MTEFFIQREKDMLHNHMREVLKRSGVSKKDYIKKFKHDCFWGGVFMCCLTIGVTIVNWFTIEKYTSIELFTGIAIAPLMGVIWRYGFYWVWYEIAIRDI